MMEDIPHCPHWTSWMVGPGRIVWGDVCCKCDVEIEETDEPCTVE